MVMDMLLIATMIYVNHIFGYIFGSMIMIAHIYLSILGANKQCNQNFKRYIKRVHISTSMHVGNNNYHYITNDGLIYKTTPHTV